VYRAAAFRHHPSHLLSPLCFLFPVSPPSSCPLCLYFGLWPVILPYVPSSQSMDRHPALCAVISIYGPSSCPMCRHHDLWTVDRILCADLRPQSTARHPPTTAPPPKKEASASFFYASSSISIDSIISWIRGDMPSAASTIYL